jgi:uncharacterized membrane protein YbjE (DUF340 family)
MGTRNFTSRETYDAKAYMYTLMMPVCTDCSIKVISWLLWLFLIFRQQLCNFSLTFGKIIFVNLLCITKYTSVNLLCITKYTSVNLLCITKYTSVNLLCITKYTSVNLLCIAKYTSVNLLCITKYTSHNKCILNKSYRKW